MIDLKQLKNTSLAMNEACVNVVLDYLYDLVGDNAHDDGESINTAFIQEKIRHFQKPEHWQTAFEDELEDFLEDYDNEIKYIEDEIEELADSVKEEKEALDNKVQGFIRLADEVESYHPEKALSLVQSIAYSTNIEQLPTEIGGI